MRAMRLVRVAVAAAAWVGGWGAARPALGNGAFPYSQDVITPADRTHEIMLATNVGLLPSTDDGRSWTWSCEQDPNGKRNLYQLGAPPRRRLFARDASGLVFTDDRGCHWTSATGGLGGAGVTGGRRGGPGAGRSSPPPPPIRVRRVGPWRPPPRAGRVAAPIAWS